MKLSLSMIRSAIAAATLAAMMFVTVAHAQTLDELKKRGSVRIGVMVDFPPYGLMNDKNQPDGYDIEVAEMLAMSLGVKAELIPITSPNRIPYLQTNRLDLLIASLAITPERAQQISFSEPYAALDVVIYGRKDLKIEKEADLLAARVGVSRGGTPDNAVTRGAPPGTQIMRFDDSSAAAHALLSGQVDAIGLGVRVIEEIDKTAPPGKFEVKFRIFRQIHGIAMRLGTPELLQAVNNFIKAKTADGELNAVHRKWLGTDLPKF